MIAKTLKVHRSTVGRILERYRKFGTCDVGKSPGRPPVLSARDINQLVRTASADRNCSVRKLANQIPHVHGVHVSSSTVYKALKKKGFMARVCRKKPLLSAINKKKRKEWSDLYASWGYDKWSQVVFSDESKINMYGCDGRKYRWGRSKKHLKKTAIKETLKYGGGSIMIWGCITRDGPGELIKIDGIMNADKYIKILEKGLFDTVPAEGFKGGHWKFQHDNDPKHTAGDTKTWLAKCHVETIQWPPQSPDMNPIEHVWQEVKRLLEQYDTRPRNKDELWERVKTVWKNLDVSYIQSLYQSMEKRVKTLGEVKGGHTKW